MRSAIDVQTNPAAAAALRARLLQVIAQHQRGDVVPAIAGYRAVLAQDPRQFDALRLLGVALRTQGEPQAAVEMFDRAIAVRRDFAEVWYHRGQALADAGQLPEAIGSVEQALALRPDMMAGWTTLGMQRHASGDHAGAVAAYDRALALDPRAVAAWNNRGLALLALKRPGEALADFDMALDCDAGLADVWTNRATALDALKRHAEALESLDRALALAPDAASTWSSRAQTLAALGDIPAALAACEHALALDPLLAQAWSQRGGAFTELGRYAEAATALDRALELAPGDPIAAWNRGFLHLLEGRFDTGWEGYEHREIISETIGRYQAPIWDGNEPLAGKIIVLHCEQGLGDTLQFCRYALVLAGMGARVVLTVPAVLHRLVSSLGRGVRVLTDGDPMPAVDLQCMLMSLPQRLKTDARSIPVLVPYLHPSEACVRRWRAVLDARTGAVPARRRFGLVISGTGGVGSMRYRAVALESLAPLLGRLAGLGIALHLMQKDVLPADEPWLERLGIADHRSGLRDFCETAGLAACMDAVISIDTSVAHLAGAMGLPLFLLLPAFPDWRWMLGREDSPWYPSARLFRQRVPGDWTATLAQLESAIMAFLVQPATAPMAQSGGRAAALEGATPSVAMPSDWRDDDRLLDLQAAARAAPHDAAAQYNLGLRYLALGCLDAGWEYFEWRQRVPRLYRPLPEAGSYWDGGGDLAGKTLLVCHEQGLGDAIQFCRYVPLLAAHGARVLLGVAPPLARLMQSLAGVERVLAGDEALPAFDLKCPILSLAQRFGTELASVPATVPYLAPPADRLAWWRQWLDQQHPAVDVLRVGLVCSGNPDHPDDLRRSIALDRFADVFAAGMQVHLLQSAVRESDEAALRSCGFIDHRERLTDLAETAALCCCMDVVISVDTAVAHLAGALHLPVYVLLAAEPDWRWLLHGERSPWYPSARLLRQAHAGDWAGPLRSAASALRALAPGPRARPFPRQADAKGAVPAAPLPVYRSAVTPPDLRGFLDAAAVQHQQGDRGAAIAAYRTLLEYEPGHFNARRLLGAALFQNGACDEAIAHLAAALELQPDSDETWLLKSEAHARLGAYDAALESSQRALALRSDKGEIWNNHGVQLYAIGRMAEALQSLERAVELAPDNPDFRVNRGLAHLASGNFAQGWVDYEHRVRMPTMKMQGIAGCPFWEPGQSLDGKTVLLNHEQGLGDTLQFCRFAPRLAALGARVVLGVEAPLRPLLQSLDGVECVVAKGDAMPRIDLQCWIMGAPLRLGTTVDTIPAAVPYLRVPPDRLARWRERLPPRGRRRLGLAFSGNPEHPNDRHRSIRLDALAPLLASLARDGVEWHLVQRDLRPTDAASIASLGIVDHRHLLNDFADTAALMQCLDGVVSVDTSVAHLAGALGMPLYLLLPATTDWRWMVERPDSPWYPTARLFRQQRLGDWADAFERLREALCAV